MSEWRSETSSDLGEAKGLLESALSSISGEPTEDQMNSIWRAYVGVEKSIMFIRLDIHEENPGRFLKAKPYAVPDERQAIQFVLKYLKKGTESFELGDFVQSLKELRESRNYLRALLREKELGKARKSRTRPS